MFGEWPSMPQGSPGLFHKFINFFVEDACRFCDPHAICDHGKCICKEGYTGDGKLCVKSMLELVCTVKAHWVIIIHLFQDAASAPYLH